jgi:3-oxoacyl-[acyl-carrier-protein] synthase II
MESHRSREMQRVVITGLGWSNALGPDTNTCWSNLVSGRSGIQPISFWDASEYSTKVAAEVRHVPADTGMESVPRAWCRRCVRLFLPVVREAFTAAGEGSAPLPGEQTGLAIGTSVNYVDLRLFRRFFHSRRPDNSGINLAGVLDGAEELSHGAFYRRQGDTIAGAAARLLKIGGPATVIDTACAASAHAIGEAYRLIRHGKVTAMIAGGSAALVSPPAILAFALLGALSRSSDPGQASRPFDRDRDGFVMGEGAGAVVLESLDSAKRRGAKIYAEMVGFGATSNAYSLTDPSPDGVSEARAMQIALGNEIRPEEVDYVAAHGTSTPRNDNTETLAIKRVFGDHARRLMVSSNKGHLGHTISAAGVCNVITAVKSIMEGCVPPTLGLRNPDSGCDLDYVPFQSRAAKIRVALANAFAFGGQNAVIAIRAWDSAAAAQ